MAQLRERKSDINWRVDNFFYIYLVINWAEDNLISASYLGDFGGIPWIYCTNHVFITAQHLKPFDFLAKTRNFLHDV